ncbi:MAG: LUC7 N terminus domain-containing protein [Trebouxia sp. A1-2]|nr:MAG: LUC7 N terminus domain-containing protein [Trebouxia sp. A1-2]
MADAMRAMLDELMGKERNVPLDQRKGTDMRFNDPEVCKYALAGLCPYGLFKNTKSDLGVCKYTVHDDDVQYGYERELMTLLNQLCRDMNRKIERQKERAIIESSARPLNAEDKARLEAIKSQEVDAMHRSQAMAEAGDVDGSMVCAQQAETYKKQHDTLHTQLTAPERVMTVCEVCGVFINSTDNDQRRQDHLTGKQYLGWKAIRDEQTRLQEQLAKQRLPPPPSRPTEEVRSSHRDREREQEPRRERDRERSHSSRDHRSRHTSDREPENGRRSSSHSHRQRSPSRKRSRSHERKREREQLFDGEGRSSRH